VVAYLPKQVDLVRPVRIVERGRQEHRDQIVLLAELGVLLLLFLIGMELSLRGFARVWRIARDGTLEEPNYEATAALVRDSRMRVLSAGGVGAAAHVERLIGTGAEAAIIGRALYTGDITVTAALAAARA